MKEEEEEEERKEERRGEERRGEEISDESKRVRERGVGRAGNEGEGIGVMKGWSWRDVMISSM